MIFQFGTGSFIRGFFDLFLQEAANDGQTMGPIVAIQSTPSNRSELLNRSTGRYNVAIRGLVDGERIDRVEPVQTIKRALRADADWQAILYLAASGEVSTIVSNATESAYFWQPEDPAAPTSFPGRLAAILLAAEPSRRSIQILPCELIERNGTALKALVMRHLNAWTTSEGILRWASDDCEWVNTLVDRITPGFPDDHPLSESDPLLVMTEPYAYWGLETKRLPMTHPSVHSVADVQPFFTRKVRILNGLHSALVTRALPQGFETVAQAMADPEILVWLERVANEEIVPTLKGRVEAPAEFAHECFLRFRNPFFKHRLDAIAKGHAIKLQHRIMPTVQEFTNRFGHTPPLLSEVLEAKI